MLCYIKDMKTFKTLAKFDSTEYSLAEGDNGEVKIYQKDAIELTTKYVGMWLIINKELFYISRATPDNDSISLIIQTPIYAFRRQVLYNGESKYGVLIKNIIDNNFGINCPDIEYKQTYINVVNTDTTPCSIETDDYGYIIPYEVFDDALYDGVAIDFTFTNDTLNIRIHTANYEVVPIVFNDGQTILESESYDPNYIAKVTILHHLPPPEGSSSDEMLYEVLDYYLSDDNQISRTPPQKRAKGIWEYYTADLDDDPAVVAEDAFSHNNDNHKIEFHSPTKLHLYQKIRMRLRNEIFSTIITSRVFSSNDYRYYYKCGNLFTTLTEKFMGETDGISSDIRAIKKRVINTENEIADLSFTSGPGYCKMPDGTLIQWGKATIDKDESLTQVASSGIYFGSFRVTLPFAFNNVNFFVSGSSRYSTGHCMPTGYVINSRTEVTFYLYDFYERPMNDGKYYINWQAVGRWK